MIKEVIGKKIKELREITGFTQEQVAQRIDVSKEYVSMLEAGSRVPSLKVLSNLAKIFHLNIEYFLSEKEPTFSILLRSEDINKKGKEELLKFKKFYDDYIFLEEITNKKMPLAPVYSMQSPAQMAAEERRRLGLGKEPIKDIFGLMESQGCHVFKHSLSQEAKIDGAFVFTEDKRAFILINNSQTKGRQVFTAAHEYCHYLKDRDYKFWIDTPDQLSEKNGKDKKPLEIFANSFAANLLMPKDKIDEIIDKNGGKKIGPEDVIYLKRCFGVSYQAILYRLKNLNYITKRQLEEYLEISPIPLELLIFGNSQDVEEKEERQYIPERYLDLALEAYLLNRISIGRLAELLNIDVISLRDTLSTAKFLRNKEAHKGEKPLIEKDNN
ncbi:MAG: XRE family transcriptional regulator [Acidobacteriota bacterium]